jgi:hypothetical protein
MSLRMLVLIVASVAFGALILTAGADWSHGDARYADYAAICLMSLVALIAVVLRLREEV